MTPAERKLRAQVAANTRWSRESGDAQAERMQKGLAAKWERDVDPNGVLPPAERRRRAEAARRAHLKRAALASARARRLRDTA